MAEAETGTPNPQTQSSILGKVNLCPQCQEEGPLGRARPEIITNIVRPGSGWKLLSSHSASFHTTGERRSPTPLARSNALAEKCYIAA